eukprot:scaffold179021_cov29-Tisochrysis_lutea.AAC.4
MPGRASAMKSLGFCRGDAKEVGSSTARKAPVSPVGLPSSCASSTGCGGKVSISTSNVGASGIETGAEAAAADGAAAPAAVTGIVVVSSPFNEGASAGLRGLAASIAASRAASSATAFAAAASSTSCAFRRFAASELRKAFAAFAWRGGGRGEEYARTHRASAARGRLENDCILTKDQGGSQGDPTPKQTEAVPLVSAGSSDTGGPGPMAQPGTARAPSCARQYPPLDCTASPRELPKAHS